jgi:hypothetical protein
VKIFRDMIRPEIHMTADEIRRLKRWLRLPPDERPGRPETRFVLAELRWRATLLCTIMAHSRGRLHARSSAGTDEQAGVLGEALDAMDRMKARTPVLDARLRDAARGILARRSPAGEAGEAGPARQDECVAPTEERRA